MSESDTDMASLSLPSSSSCSARVYVVDVGMSRSNKHVYDVLDGYSQTKMPQGPGPHKVGEIDIKTPLESQINGHKSTRHFAQRESETMLTGIKVTDTYM